jgi:hypothetical protein
MLTPVRPSWYVFSSLLARRLSTIFNSKENRFNDVHVHPNDLQQVDVSQFDPVLKRNKAYYIRYTYIPELLTLHWYLIKPVVSLMHWEKIGKSSAWLHVPMQQASCIEIASKHGFKYHHAEDNIAVVFKWLRTDSESKIPRYATHQMGCAGIENSVLNYFKSSNASRHIYILCPNCCTIYTHSEITHFTISFFIRLMLSQGHR